MDREKQIEEMAFDLIIATSPLGVEDLTQQFDYVTVAKFLYNIGYRKQSEVVKEIFEEIDNIIYNLRDSPFYSISDAVYELTELKKKYTEVKEK